MKILFTTIAFSTSMFWCAKHNHQILIHQQPVWMEEDTFDVSPTHRQFNKAVYYLINGKISDTSLVKEKIKEFVVRRKFSNNVKYGNFMVSFYKENQDLNKSNIDTLSERAIGILFSEAKSDLIASYYYRKGKLIMESFNFGGTP